MKGFFIIIGIAFVWGQLVRWLFWPDTVPIPDTVIGKIFVTIPFAEFSGAMISGIAVPPVIVLIVWLFARLRHKTEAEMLSAEFEGE